MKKVFFLSVVVTIVVVFMGCERTYPEGYVTLQNQIEHSGIAIEIIELDTFILTGETGHYDLGFLKEGAYHLNFVFPYYKNEKQKIRITHGMLDVPIPDIELQQILYHTIYADDSVLRVGDIIHYGAKVKNQSNNIPVPIWWNTVPNWMSVFYDDSAGLVECSHGPYTMLVRNTIFPYESDSLTYALRIGGARWIFGDPSYKGIVAVTMGILTRKIFNELDTTWIVYFPRRTDCRGLYTMSEYVYKKLPKEFIKIE